MTILYNDFLVTDLMIFFRIHEEHNEHGHDKRRVTTLNEVSAEKPDHIVFPQ